MPVSVRLFGEAPGPPRHFFLSFLGFSIITKYCTYRVYFFTTTKTTTNIVNRCEYVPQKETIARLPGGLSEQIAIKGRSSW